MHNLNKSKYVKVTRWMKIYNYNLLYLFTCFTKFNLKSDNDLQFTKSAGSEFHSVIDLRKKENLMMSLDTSGTLY